MRDQTITLNWADSGVSGLFWECEGSPVLTSESGKETFTPNLPASKAGSLQWGGAPIN